MSSSRAANELIWAVFSYLNVMAELDEPHADKFPKWQGIWHRVFFFWSVYKDLHQLHPITRVWQREQWPAFVGAIIFAAHNARGQGVWGSQVCQCHLPCCPMCLNMTCIRPLKVNIFCFLLWCCYPSPFSLAQAFWIFNKAQVRTGFVDSCLSGNYVFANALILWWTLTSFLCPASLQADGAIVLECSVTIWQAILF